MKHLYTYINVHVFSSRSLRAQYGNAWWISSCRTSYELQSREWNAARGTRPAAEGSKCCVCAVFTMRSVFFLRIMRRKDLYDSKLEMLNEHIKHSSVVSSIFACIKLLVMKLFTGLRIFLIYQDFLIFSLSVILFHSCESWKSAEKFSVGGRVCRPETIFLIF